MASVSAPRRVGRRPGPTKTREAIVEAASRHFAESGYAAASLRGIAREADVDPALISHFFGSKAQLFVAATHLPMQPEEAVATCLQDGRQGVGRQVATVFLRHWHEAEDRSPILALLSLGMTDRGASSLLHEFLLDQLLFPLLDQLGSDQRELRAGLVSAYVTGLGLGRYVYGLIPADRVDDATLIDTVGPVLQVYLTETLPGQTPVRPAAGASGRAKHPSTAP